MIVAQAELRTQWVWRAAGLAELPAKKFWGHFLAPARIEAET